MKPWILPLAVLLCFAITGCQMFDTLSGVKEVERPVVDEEGKPVIDPETGKQKIETVVVDDPDNPVPGLLDQALSGIPIIGGILGALRWGYVEVRKRRLDGTAKALVAGITNAVDRKELTKADLYRLTTEASHIYANREFFEELVAKVKAEIRKKNKDAIHAAGPPAASPPVPEGDG